MLSRYMIKILKKMDCSTDINYSFSNFTRISHVVNFNNHTLNLLSYLYINY